MALADRLREAARPTNTIENVQEPQQGRPEGLHGASPSPGPSPAPGASTGAPGAKPAAFTTEPEAIAKAFYIEELGDGSRRYYEDYQRKNLALRATDTSVSTKREDLKTIQAAITIAEARGWTTVEVNGTANFKREAWIEAQARGLDVRGYQANDLDRQEAERRRAERGQLPPNEVRPTAPQAVVEAARVVTPPPPVQVAVPTPPAHAHAPGHAAGPEHPAHGAAPAGEKPSHADNLKALRRAEAELSPDGRLVLAALSEKIDRQLNRANTEAKAEVKAYAAAALLEKERTEGPVVLSGDQKRAATAPEPGRSAPAAVPEPERRQEPDAPRLARGR